MLVAMLSGRKQGTNDLRKELIPIPLDLQEILILLRAIERLWK